MRLLIIILFITNEFYANAQSDGRIVLNLEPDPSFEKIDLPFSGIKIIDARFDRTNIGCVASEVSFRGMSEYKRQAVFPDSLQNYLSKLLYGMCHINPLSPDTLVILIKEFRITDHLVKKVHKNYDFESLLNFSASYFTLRNGNFFRLFSINDLLDREWESNKPTKKNIIQLRNDAVTLLVADLVTNKSWNVLKESFSPNEIAMGLNKRFGLTVLKDSLPRKGVYGTFSEFCNNQPSVTDIRILKKGNRIELKDSDNHPINLKNFWGLCDGEKRYIIFRNQLCELIKSDRSFRFVSYKEQNDLQKPPDAGSTILSYGLLPAIITSGNKIAAEYLYLNMSNGLAYLEEWYGRSSMKFYQKEILE